MSLPANPVRDVAVIKSKRPPNGAPALTVEQLRDLLTGLRASDYCREHDLADPFTILIGTGLRRGELLALRWSDYDEIAGTLKVCGKVVRVTGKGLLRDDETKDRGRSPHHRVATIRHRGAGRAAPAAVLGRASDDHVPVHGWHLARPE